MDMLWFDQCKIYLDRVEGVDEYFTLYDTLPNATKEEKEQKRLIFNRLMRFIQEKRQCEKDLDDRWKLS